MKRLALISILFTLLAACNPAPTPTAAPLSDAPAAKPSSTGTPLPSGTPAPTNTTKPSDTPPPSPTLTDTPTDTSTPSSPAQLYDTFISQISRSDARVEYSPQVIRPGDKLTATIYLPIEKPGSHGLPFADVYDVTVEVYTSGETEFDLGQFTGTRVHFTGEAISGSSADGFLILTWRSPTYSADIPYVYLFSIYPKSSASRAKLARLQANDPLQTITLSGLPDVTSQVSIEDWPTPEGSGEEDEGSGNSGGNTGGSSGDSNEPSGDDSSGGPSGGGGGSGTQGGDPGPPDDGGEI
jgi:uncharacterized membrane protein YgcG